MDYYNIGEKIREERKKIGMTQEDLAEKVGISVNFVSLIENGKNMSLDTMIKIANTFNVSVDYLLNDSININTDNITAQINHSLGSLTTEEKLYFLNMIKQYKQLKNDK